MKRCVIFCAGGFSELLAPLDPHDLVIAADGGLRHTEAVGVKPDIILGDFDSLGKTPDGAEVFPVEKDDTDSMLAIKRGLEMGCGQFLLYGALDGDRLEHTVANYQALMFLADRVARGWLIGKKQIATVIKNGGIAFPAGCKGYLSVFCLGPDARGVAIRGTKYKLEDATLTADFPLGVSNQFTDEPGQVLVKNGKLLLIWDRENGIW